MSTAKVPNGNHTVTNRTESFTRPNNHRSQQLKVFFALSVGKFLDKKVNLL
jgi:hypothetical protein